jgi:hypothetical protein
MLKKKHQHWTIDGDGAVNSKKINEGVTTT